MWKGRHWVLGGSSMLHRPWDWSKRICQTEAVMTLAPETELNIVIQFSLRTCEGREKGTPCILQRNKLRDRGLSHAPLWVSQTEAMSALNPSGLPTPLLSLDPSFLGIVVSVSTSHACSPLDHVRATSGSLRDQRLCPGQGGQSAMLAGWLDPW